MKNNQKGIALITALVFGFVAVSFIGALLYILLTGSKTSGTVKRYSTALEAAKGGAQLVISKILSDEELTCNGGDPCTPCPTSETNTCKIDLSVSTLGNYNIEAYLLNELDSTSPIYKIYSIKVKSFESGNIKEKAIIEFVYKVE